MSVSVQQEIVDTLRRLVPDRSAARRAADDAVPLHRPLWTQLAELGLVGVSLPERWQGLGLGLAEDCAIAETLGGAVAPVPVVSTALASHIVASGEGSAAERAAADILSGSRIVGAGLSTRSGLPALQVADGRISGEVGDLFEGGLLDAVLLHGEGRWWLVDLAGPGVTRTVQPGLDFTRPQARLTLESAPALPVSQAPADGVVSLAYVLIAAEALGAAQTALDLTCDYALQRHQFGQPIGRFQALKQKMADCLLALEGARSALWGALRSVKDGLPDEIAARLAKAEAGRAARFVTAEAVQMHGAIGCTWEHDLHLLMRRAKQVEISLGTPDAHVRHLGDQFLAGLAAPRAAQDPTQDRAEENAPDLGFVPSEEDEAFIADFRQWLDAHVPAERLAELRRSGMDARRAWQAELAEAGWTALHWAKWAGGREASFTQQVLYYAEMARRGLPPLPGNRGLMLVGPTLIAHGSEEQRKLLEPTRRSDILWAGGFSERGAGSDLASLATRGVIDGDELVINGHKIWTSQAQIADWMYALIRTDPSRPKHEGISVVLIPMNAPGVEVRPIRRNNGDFHFNEVFLDDVRVPLTNIVGRMNDGWNVNRTTMVGEHLTNFLGSQAAQAGTVERIARTLLKHEGQWGPDPALRDRLAKAWVSTQIVRLHGLRNVARFASGDNPGAETSISKLVGQETERALFELMIDVQGAAGLVESKWTRAYLSTRASTIGGGTSEIHRNKLAERVLGMPRDLWADDDRASGAVTAAAAE